MASMNTDKNTASGASKGVSIGSVPGGAPGGAPAAPATKVAKPKREARVLTPEQQKLREQMLNSQKAFNASIGKVAKARSSKGIGFGGWTGEETITVVPGASGFATDEQKAIAKEIGNGIKMKDLFAKNLPGLDGNAWVWYRVKSNSIKINGLTLKEAFDKAQAK